MRKIPEIKVKNTVIEGKMLVFVVGAPLPFFAGSSIKPAGNTNNGAKMQITCGN